MSRFDIRSYAVIGAGNMGSGIAQKIATEGYPVVLVDLDDEKVERGLGIIREMLQQGVERRIFRPEQADAILDRVRGTSDWDELGEVDLVVEAVFEDLDVKRKVFRRLGEVCKPEAILGTNTSSFFVKDVAAVTPHPERVIGLHYFFHPAKNRLVEVIGHEDTDPEAFTAAWLAQEAIGKTPIRSADAPGFVVNRYFVPWLNEAVRLLEEGVADIPTIEWAAKKAFGVGMGPFELMNVTGVPIAMHAANTLGHELHLFYAPAQALVDQVAKGENWELAGKPDESKYDEIADRLLGVTFYIATKLVDEQVATVEDTDIGARVGLRWPKGPFELLNKVGVARARLLAEAAVRAHGLETPALLRNADEQGVPIHLVSLGHRGNLTSVWIDRPDALNALNEEVVLQLESALSLARAGAEQGIVIGGSGKAFVAGADIKFFVDNLERRTFPAIYEFTERGQKLLRTLSGGSLPVVARAQGLALGGGAELALACDWIAASPKASFGFPETGLGIFPGLGGTQRLPRRVGLPIAKYLVYTGRILDAQSAHDIGLIDAVAPFSDLDEACEELTAEGPVPERTARKKPKSLQWLAVWNFFDRHSVDQILSGQADTLVNEAVRDAAAKIGDQLGAHPVHGDVVLEKAVKQMQYKSYHALRLAEKLFDAGASLHLNEALDLELAHLEEAFSHPDAMEGLSSLLQGRRPEFHKATVG